MQVSAAEYHDRFNNRDGFCVACDTFKGTDIGHESVGQTCPTCGEDQVVGVDTAVRGGDLVVTET